MIYIDSLHPDSIALCKNPTIKGITCNPTIIKRDQPHLGFSDTLYFLEKINGEHFIQGSIETFEWLTHLKDAVKSARITPKKFVIKLCWEPVKAALLIPELHALGFKTCATAVYSLNQYYTALTVKVDYVAVYFDRMKKSGIEPREQIARMLEIGDFNSTSTRILAASIKDVDTANQLLFIGAHDLTLPLDVARDFISGTFPADDANRFEADFKL